MYRTVTMAIRVLLHKTLFLKIFFISLNKIKELFSSLFNFPWRKRNKNEDEFGGNDAFKRKKKEILKETLTKKEEKPNI